MPPAYRCPCLVGLVREHQVPLQRGAAGGVRIGDPPRYPGAAARGDGDQGEVQLGRDQGTWGGWGKEWGGGAHGQVQGGDVR